MDDHYNMHMEEYKEGESLPSSPTELVGDSLPAIAGLDVPVPFDKLPAFHLKRTRALWRLHDQTVAQAKQDAELSATARSQILQRCARAATDLIGIERKLSGADGSGDQGGTGGVIIMQSKIRPEDWTAAAAEAIEGEGGEDDD